MHELTDIRFLKKDLGYRNAEYRVRIYSGREAALPGVEVELFVCKHNDASSQLWI